MLKGLHTKGVMENTANYVNSMNGQMMFCRACALGCALIGKFDGDYLKAEEVYDARYHKRRSYDTAEAIIADLLDISPELAIEVEHKHLNGMPVEQIAAWLKSSEGEGNHV
jgi:hypothetical protein